MMLKIKTIGNLKLDRNEHNYYTLFKNIVIEVNSMSDVKWTDEQLQAIKEKGENILVAAGAGSGKTAVLVERIIQKIINEKIDIDKILVVTFTNAAAAEMRERILEAIYKKLDETPEDEHLQKQIVLLGKANISTIHSFCLDVIKNNFYQIEVSPNFRIGDTAEIELIKQETIEEIFEKLYEEENKGFIKLLDTYEGYRNDDTLKSIILKIYNFIQSNPFPEKWLSEKVEEFNIDENTEILNTIWGKIIVDEFKGNIENSIKKLERMAKNLDLYSETKKYADILRADINEYNNIIYNAKTWDEMMQKAYSVEYISWKKDSKITLDIKDKAKELRDTIKKKFVKDRETYFAYDSSQIKSDAKFMYNILKSIKEIIISFSELYEKKKSEKNVIDFNNIEHFALEILLKQDEKGNYEKTETAKKYMKQFTEIAVDEYQDSNMVQEQILTSVSNGKNMFMVGDVKQSIYKFRQARPELFLEKYEKYKLKQELRENDDLKIQLFKNFRSRKNILDLTNIIFENIMSKKLGDIDYTDEEFLKQDKDYDKPEKDINYAGKAELHIIDMAKIDEEEDDDEQAHTEKTEIEAKFVVNSIKKLKEEKYYVFDKKQRKYRPIEFRDIVILLRATTNLAPIYEKALIEEQIPVFTDTGEDYLDTIEIQTIMSVLKVIDNPLQDIPLVAVMRSSIGNFSDNDLLKIRLHKQNGYYYEALEKAKSEEENMELRQKIEEFLNKIEEWRVKSEYIRIDELIWTIYLETGYYNYVSLMPDGNVRVANLKMLFEKAKKFESTAYKGLFNFINFMNKLKLSNSDTGAAKLIGENENVVRIMSIHKSKGLEFPIVFLSDTAKQFNLRDLNDSIVLHQDIGFGVKYIDTDIKVSYNTISRDAIRIKARQEAIAEEMRVLYVALTRAREKLIITGVEKNYKKSISDKTKELEAYGNINSSLIKQYKSYLAWLELVYLKNEKIMKELMDVYVYNKKDIINKSENEENIDKQDIINKWIPKDKSIAEKINNLLNWSYKNQFSTTLESKTSVSKIKQIKQKNQNTEFIIPKPKFLTKTSKLTGAEKGTLIHLCLQKMDLNKINTKEQIIEMIEEMVKKEIINENEAKQIDADVLYNFTQSKLAEKIRKAKKVYKEEPFYINIPAKEIYEEGTDENILVQGIIDLYYEDENGNLVLIDYKTDYVQEGKELIQKYHVQLEIYKKALEQATNKKVTEVYIYSTCLGTFLNWE
ncbi:MAG: helicase-exonuclease AddAB subunit AddA [Clostridia bacterium]|nr:helicase-exonuclease AddAB subunit AddA [Clostridia bacterium]